jgi:hypothetical protein
VLGGEFKRLILRRTFYCTIPGILREVMTSMMEVAAAAAAAFIHSVAPDSYSVSIVLLDCVHVYFFDLVLVVLYAY